MIGQKVLITLCLSLFLSACEKKEGAAATSAGGGKGKAEGKGGGRRGAGGGKSKPVVKVASVKPETRARELHVVAPLIGRAQADVFSKVSGKMSYFGPKEGEAVQNGQLLFRVDRNDPGESFLNVPISSPLTGWVGRWWVTNIGEQVSAQEAVVTIVDDRSLRATTLLPLQDWLDVRKNTVVKAEALNETRNAKILAVARSAEVGSGRGSVTVEIPNEQRNWRSGMNATVTFLLEPRLRTIIDASSLTITNDGAYVYAVEGDVAKRKMVEFEVIDNDTVEIIKGLNAEEVIITVGSNLVSNNAPVEIFSESKQP